MHRKAYPTQPAGRLAPRLGLSSIGPKVAAAPLRSKSMPLAAPDVQDLFLCVSE